MLFAKTGSVGVTQAPITRVSRNVKPGMRPQTRRLVMNHAHNITGPRRMDRLSHSFRRYAFGREIPNSRASVPRRREKGKWTGEEDLYADDDSSDLIGQVIYVG